MILRYPKVTLVVTNVNMVNFFEIRGRGSGLLRLRLGSRGLWTPSYRQENRVFFVACVQKKKNQILKSFKKAYAFLQ